MDLNRVAVHVKLIPIVPPVTHNRNDRASVSKGAIRPNILVREATDAEQARPHHNTAMFPLRYRASFALLLQNYELAVTDTLLKCLTKFA